MKNQNTLKLNIPTPCAQDWNEMTETERGRFCASCSKHVVDFTNFTDRQLKDFFSKDTGKVCGRLTVDQMERELIMQEHSKLGLFIPRLFIGTALAVALASKAEAQKRDVPVYMLGKVAQSELVKNNTPEPVIENSNYIFGKIVDSLKQESIPFASIVIKETDISTVADLDGNFKLEVPDQFNGSKVVLEFTSVGFEKKELEILVVGSPVRAEVILNQPQSQPPLRFMVGGITGDVVCVTQKKEKKNLWQRIFK